MPSSRNAPIPRSEVHRSAKRVLQLHSTIAWYISNTRLMRAIYKHSSDIHVTAVVQSFISLGRGH